jgi:transcriptional regulator with XRE-family HTH domain
VSDIGKRIGRRIRDLRTQRQDRWTQEDLAERAKISVSFLSMIERGERVAHVETLASLAEALGVRRVSGGQNTHNTHTHTDLSLYIYIHFAHLGVRSRSRQPGKPRGGSHTHTHRVCG